MRKFKLIKEYPGSPDLGTVVESPLYKLTNGEMIGGTYLESGAYTEYWEEVIEPTFQIISFTATNVWSGKVATLLPNGQYSTNPNSNCGWTLREMLEVGNCVKNEELQIHSVKRLSDGEIFTVGDRAKTITSKGSHDIRQFRIRQRCIGKDATGTYLYGDLNEIWVDWEKDCGGNWLDSTEKVIQKDFEIMTFNYKGGLYNKNEQGYAIGTSFTHSLESHLKDGVSKVHAVKRLSDGEIFTVGDNIEFTRGDEVCVRTIEGIIVWKSDITIRHEKGTISNETIGGIFQEITKRKKPIFTTEDGVNIFVGDSVYVVSEKGELLDYVYSNVRNDGRMSCRKYFSTKQAAQDYVDNNQPRLSIKDCLKIKDAWFENQKSLEESIKEYLKENNK